MRIPRGIKAYQPTTMHSERLVEESVVVTPDIANDIALIEEGNRLTPQDRYLITVHQGTDTLHVNPREECNTDDADILQTIDKESAGALLKAGVVRSCWHCVPIPEG